MKNLTVMNHPLISHKLAILRHKDTDGKAFRELVSEIAMLICYEATRDMKTTPVDVPTPLMTAKCHMITSEKPVLVPILRAGLGMVDGMLTILPAAKIGHIGMCRNHDTLEPEQYYCNLPSDISERTVFVLDPMLATGGSLAAAITLLKEKGAKNIKVLCIVGAEVGCKKVLDTHPDVNIYLGVLDDRLNEKGYILPGLGDAGDRLFGTE
ncbi:MAG: uracil phosphoribosyltransferase [Ruminococcaceae bacterium]|nr:uracil phosphoribosyltransferase [Oscillospiraceae bacterium]